jgi:hypothetical protein
LLRYNSDTPGVEYNNGSAWTTLGAGGGGSSAPSDDSYPVDWYIEDGFAITVFDKTGSTLNCSADIFNVGATGGAVTGQTVYIHTDGGYEGLYVLGSTSVLSAVPITRHPDWPGTREIHAGMKFYCMWATRLSDYGFLEAAYVSTSTEKIGLPGGPAPAVGSVVKFRLRGTGATMPAGLSTSTVYWVVDFTQGDGFAGSDTIKVSASPGGSPVSITSTGTNGTLGIADIIFTPPFNDSLGIEITLTNSASFAPVWTWPAETSSPSYTHSAYKRHSAGVDWSALLNPLVYGSYADGGSIALGSGARDFGTHSSSIAIGDYSKVAGTNGIAIGGFSQALGYAVAIGDGADAAGDSSIAIGSITRVATGVKFAVSLASNGYSARNEGTVVLGAKPSVSGSTGHYTSTILERISTDTINATETTISAISIADCCSFTVRGVLQASSLGSANSVIWEIQGAVTCNSSNRISDLLFKRIGGNGASATGAMKVRYTLTSDGGTNHTLSFLAKGLASETVIWTGDLWLQGTPDSAITTVSNYGIPQAWAVGPSVRATASTALSAGQFVQVYNASGMASVRPADAYAPYEATGFVMEDYASSDTVVVYLSGENPYLTGLTVGSVYLSTTAGAVTSTVYSTTGSLVQQVGTALSSTKMLVQIGVPVML